MDLLTLFKYINSISQVIEEIFKSEYECGVVVGTVSTGGRGALLSADERRDVLRRLGGGKSPKLMRAASSSSGTTNGTEGVAAAATGTNNEILNQMQSQRSVLTSFARSSSLGGSARGNILNARRSSDITQIGE